MRMQTVPVALVLVITELVVLAVVLIGFVLISRGTRKYTEQEMWGTSKETRHTLLPAYRPLLVNLCHFLLFLLLADAVLWTATWSSHRHRLMLWGDALALTLLAVDSIIPTVIAQKYVTPTAFRKSVVVSLVRAVASGALLVGRELVDILPVRVVLGVALLALAGVAPVAGDASILFGYSKTRVQLSSRSHRCAFWFEMVPCCLWSLSFAPRLAVRREHEPHSLKTALDSLSYGCLLLTLAVHVLLPLASFQTLVADTKFWRGLGKYNQNATFGDTRVSELGRSSIDLDRPSSCCQPLDDFTAVSVEFPAASPAKEEGRSSSSSAAAATSFDGGDGEEDIDGISMTMASLTTTTIREEDEESLGIALDEDEQSGTRHKKQLGEKESSSNPTMESSASNAMSSRDDMKSLMSSRDDGRSMSSMSLSPTGASSRGSRRSRRRRPEMCLGMASAALQEIIMDADRDGLMLDFASLRIIDHEVIGKGTTAFVYRGVYQDQPVAVKVFNPLEITSEEIKNFGREVGLSASIGRHRNVALMYGLCVRPPQICTVGELCERGTLASFLSEEWEFPRKLRAMVDCATAVAHIHSVGVWHRDIKAQNFLISASGIVKLCDFGESLSRPTALSVAKKALTTSPVSYAASSPSIIKALGAFSLSPNPARRSLPPRKPSYEKKQEKLRASSPRFPDRLHKNASPATTPSRRFDLRRNMSYASPNSTGRSLKKQSSASPSGTWWGDSFESDDDEEPPLEIVGTVAYMAPELVAADRNYTESIDVYALAVVLRCIWCGEAEPWPTLQTFEVFAAVTRGERPSMPDDCPELIAWAIGRAWAQEEKDRPDAKVFHTELVEVMLNLSGQLAPRASIPSDAGSSLTRDLLATLRRSSVSNIMTLGRRNSSTIQPPTHV